MICVDLLDIKNRLADRKEFNTKDTRRRNIILRKLEELAVLEEQGILYVDVPTMVICIPDKDDQHMENLEESECPGEEFYDCMDKDEEYVGEFCWQSELRNGAFGKVLRHQ